MTSQRVWWWFFYIYPWQDSHLILTDDRRFFNRQTALRYNLNLLATRFFGTQCKSTVTLYRLFVYRRIPWNDKNPFFRQYLAKYFLHFLIILTMIIIWRIRMMMIIIMLMMMMMMMHNLRKKQMTTTTTTWHFKSVIQSALQMRRSSRKTGQHGWLLWSVWPIYTW